tara:strand:+ start:1875 stop:2567 length:693 start_codon:yes stop_codon:yes gene_type:complete
MNRLAIVPARAGSKRFPGKNWAKLGGYPLWMWSVEVASVAFDSAVFTTDSTELLHDVVSREGNFITGLLRPKELSSDTSKVIDTVNWIYDIYDKKPSKPDEIWLLLPTCPLRKVEDAVDAQDKLSDYNDCDGIISITDYEFPPQLGLTQEGGQIRDWHESKPWQSGNSRSQDHEKIYRPNGALYGMRWEAFRKNRNFYKGNICSHYMPRERSVDIDNEIDLKLAEALINE